MNQTITTFARLFPKYTLYIVAAFGGLAAFFAGGFGILALPSVVWTYQNADAVRIVEAGDPLWVIVAQFVWMIVMLGAFIAALETLERRAEDNDNQQTEASR